MTSRTNRLVVDYKYLFSYRIDCIVGQWSRRISDRRRGKVYQTTVVGLGHSTCVAIGGDHFNGTNFIDCMRKFIVDPHTEDVCTISWLTGRSLQRVNQRLKDRCRASRAVEIALLKKLNKSMEYAFGENGANSIKHFVSPICNNVRWVASGQSFHLQMVYKCYTT
ncbi:unnamed protein product [Lactuca virosa]|uniref:Uncharacterized protein n=1 Tax=Lactuca virosa TaxID=75947 RepID=A0AAU9MCX7_9ASTR|nr:unnamed protein product [Lactuca virosa]